MKLSFFEFAGDSFCSRKLVEINVAFSFLRVETNSFLVLHVEEITVLQSFNSNVEFEHNPELTVVIRQVAMKNILKIFFKFISYSPFLNIFRIFLNGEDFSSCTTALGSLITRFPFSSTVGGGKESINS